MVYKYRGVNRNNKFAYKICHVYSLHGLVDTREINPFTSIDIHYNMAVELEEKIK